MAASACSRHPCSCTCCWRVCLCAGARQVVQRRQRSPPAASCLRVGWCCTCAGGQPLNTLLRPQREVVPACLPPATDTKSDWTCCSTGCGGGQMQVSINCCRAGMGLLQTRRVRRAQARRCRRSASPCRGSLPSLLSASLTPPPARTCRPQPPGSLSCSPPGKQLPAQAAVLIVAVESPQPPQPTPRACPDSVAVPRQGHRQAPIPVAAQPARREAAAAAAAAAAASPNCARKS